MVTSRRGLSGIERGQGVCSQWKKHSAREETNAVSSTIKKSVQNRHHKPLHPLSHQHQEVEVRREEGASEAEASLGEPIDSRAKTSCKVLAPNHFVSIGTLPNASFINPKRGVYSAKSARFRTERLRNNQIKSRRRVITKVQLLL